ncbi:MAG: cell division protein FtsZ [Candidatus Poribacteria bacterium]|nr:cell division protein FtsZ [Candidatus Poribacteria bacterium]
MIEFEHTELDAHARIKVVGVGGGGNNAVKHMIEAELTGVDFYVINTDLQVLQQCHNATQLQIGTNTTSGLGAGANPEIGRKAAEENLDDLQQIVEGADMVFVTAGMGGGTGTGAAPVVARLAKDLGALTIGVITRPFRFEGRNREIVADQGLDEMRDSTDSVIVIPNQRLMEFVDKKMPLRASFRMVDDVLLNAIQSISDMIQVPGEINLDFADIKTIMEDSGSALMGIGFGTGDTRAQTAAQNAISSPLLEQSSIEGATGIIVNFTAPPNFAAHELDDAMEVIVEASGTNQVIFGLAYNEELEDELYITAIATGFDANRPIMESEGEFPLGGNSYDQEAQSPLGQSERRSGARPGGNPFAQPTVPRSNMRGTNLTPPAPSQINATRAVARNQNRDLSYVDDDQTFLTPTRRPRDDNQPSRTEAAKSDDLDKPTFLRLRKPPRSSS